jgi:hypothetical protein
VPIQIELQSPEGAVIETLDDADDVLHRTLPYYDDATFSLLRKIDWYGDTEFRAPQMSVLLEELDRIMPKAASPEQVAFMQKLKQIAARCASMPGCALKFVGD